MIIMQYKVVRLFVSVDEQTCFTRVNPSAKAVINGCPGELKITNNKYKNYVQCSQKYIYIFNNYSTRARWISNDR